MNAVRNLSDGLTEGDRRGAELAGTSDVVRPVDSPVAAEVQAPAVAARSEVRAVYSYNGISPESVRSGDPM